MTNTENQSKILTPTQSSSKPKVTGMTKRKASSPMKSSPPRKLSDNYIRHNNRRIRTRQPPSLVGERERVFTSLVETSDDRPGENTSTYITTPPSNTSLEAITIELESHQIDVVNLISLSTSSPRQSFVVFFHRRWNRSHRQNKAISNALTNPFS